QAVQGPLPARIVGALEQDDALIHRAGDPRGQGVGEGGLSLLHHDRRALDLDARSEEHTSELQSRFDLVCRLLLEKKKPPARSARNSATTCSGSSCAPFTSNWAKRTPKRPRRTSCAVGSRRPSCPTRSARRSNLS